MLGNYLGCWVRTIDFGKYKPNQIGLIFGTRKESNYFKNMIIIGFLIIQFDPIK
jgi:hypothetical protein